MGLSPMATLLFRLVAGAAESNFMVIKPGKVHSETHFLMVALASKVPSGARSLAVACSVVKVCELRVIISCPPIWRI